MLMLSRGRHHGGRGGHREWRCRAGAAILWGMKTRSRAVSWDFLSRDIEDPTVLLNTFK
jgi:hypothetical protein